MLSPSLRIKVCQNPVGPTCLRQLDASLGASEPHDFAVREKRHSSKAPPRPPHPAPYVRDDRETPLCLGRDDSLYSCFYQTAKRKIFATGAGQPNCKTARRANHPAPSGSKRSAQGAARSQGPRGRPRPARSATVQVKYFGGPANRTASNPGPVLLRAR